MLCLYVCIKIQNVAYCPAQSVRFEARTWCIGMCFNSGLYFYPLKCSLCACCLLSFYSLFRSIGQLLKSCEMSMYDVLNCTFPWKTFTIGVCQLREESVGWYRRVVSIWMIEFDTCSGEDRRTARFCVGTWLLSFNGQGKPLKHWP